MFVKFLRCNVGRKRVVFSNNTLLIVIVINIFSREKFCFFIGIFLFFFVDKVGVFFTAKLLVIIRSLSF